MLELAEVYRVARREYSVHPMPNWVWGGLVSEVICVGLIGDKRIDEIKLLVSNVTGGIMKHSQ